MKYEILDESGNVVNTIVADISFVEAVYPGQYRELVEPEEPVDPLEYQRQRAAEYPPITDYLDGVVKNDQAQIQAYIDACLAVKAKYPKPS
jgi:hypothetical protein